MYVQCISLIIQKEEWYRKHLNCSFLFNLAPYCSINDPPGNGGVLNRTREIPGSNLQYYCYAGYRLVGPRNSTCRLHPNGLYHWDTPAPLCQGNAERRMAFTDSRGIHFNLMSGESLANVIGLPLVTMLTCVCGIVIHRLFIFLLGFQHSRLQFMNIS